MVYGVRIHKQWVGQARHAPQPDAPTAFTKGWRPLSWYRDVEFAEKFDTRLRAYKWAKERGLVGFVVTQIMPRYPDEPDGGRTLALAA